MPAYYFEISLEGNDIIKQLYQESDQDLLGPWYSALSDVYGQKTSSYDGYMSKALTNNSNELKLHCYVLEDEVKIRKLKSESSQMTNLLVSRVEMAIKTHIEKLNIRFKKVSVQPIIV